MKKLLLLVFAALALAVPTAAQTNPSGQTAQNATSEAKPKKQIFRANKAQITEVQTMLKAKSLYSGEATGKLDVETRAAIKSYQKDNGLKPTGTLNRATLEKMGIELTDAQKAIPASASSYASAGGSGTGSTAKTRGPIFRATKDQIIEAQRMLKTANLYSGEETGKLDPDTRAALKKYQQANGLKVTGTLNQATIEKMGIALTDKQKEMMADKN
ncbi:MAG: peptidoglycan-binding domain-containing protein [Pyrinomonadaceae bacterium]